MKSMLLVLCSGALLFVAGCGGGGGGETRETTAATPKLVQGAITSQPATNTGIEGVAMGSIPEFVGETVRLRREALQGAAISVVRVLDNHEIGRVFTDGAG